MTNEIEKQFFDTFGIECNISYHQQFNCAQIPRGLEVYKEREELEKEGAIKIWHRMLNPRPANDCIYWGEYHYPEITDYILLELICICSKYGFCPTARNVKDLKLKVLKRLFKLKNNLKNNYEHQGCHNAFVRKVRTLFEEQ